MLARTGEDEFVALLPDPGPAPEDRVTALARAVAEEIAKDESLAGGTRASLAFGYAVHPADGADREALARARAAAAHPDGVASAHHRSPGLPRPRARALRRRSIPAPAGDMRSALSLAVAPVVAIGDALAAFAQAHVHLCLGALAALLLTLAALVAARRRRGSGAAAFLLLWLGAVPAAQLLAFAGRVSLAGWAGKVLYLGLVLGGGSWWASARRDPTRSPVAAAGLRGARPADTWRSPALWGWLALVLAVALPIRAWELERYPLFFGGEYEWLADVALNVLEGDSAIAPVMLLDLPSRAYLHERLAPHLFWADLVALSLWLFGASISSVRLVSAFFGLLGITACFLVTWRFFDRRAAIASAFLMAVSPVWIASSRDAHQLHYVLPFALWMLGLLLASLERPSVRSIVGTCALAGLALHFYHPAYVVIPFVAVTWLVVLVRDADWRRAAARPLLLGVAVAGLLAIPPLYYSLSERFAQEQYLPLKHLAGNSAVSVTKERAFARLAQNLDRTWHHFIFEGDPLRISQGVENYVQIGGTVHLPLVASLFLIGLGVCAVEARHRRSVRLLLFLTGLGILPGLFSHMVLTRRLIVFDACLYVIAGIGALAAGAALVAVLGARRRHVVTATLAATALLLVATGWSAFVDLSERAEPDFDRQFAETVSAGLESGDMAVMLFTFRESRRTIQLLVWDRMRRPESRRFLSWAPSPIELAGAH